MRRIVHFLLVIGVLAGTLATSPVSAAQSDNLLDLADVPLPVQALPESGYQVLTGDYLMANDVIEQIADPRNLEHNHVAEIVENIGISRAYVLDLVLPEDRGYQDSPVLAVQQTNVYVVANDDATDDLVDLLTDYSSTAYVTEKEPATDDAYTVATSGEAGDMLRTVVTDGRVVIEIVSLDVTGTPDETEHILIVQATLERLETVRTTGDAGLSSASLTLAADENSAPFVHTQQSGVHGIYRVRDGIVQPATGELNTEDLQPGAGLESLYFASDAARTGSGNAVISIWLAEFDTDSSASLYYDNLISTSPSGQLYDPYVVMDPDEEWTEQGIVGLYRVTGDFEGARYSGNVEIRIQGDTIVVVGYRSVGTSLPSTDITSALVDHQIDCIDSGQICSPFDLTSALPPVSTPAQATPIAQTSTLGSAEFGWSLPELGPEWTVTEEFSEPGYDRIGLINGVSQFEFQSVINHHGEPMQCVLDEQHMLEIFEEHSDINVWEDSNGNTEGGNESDHAWIVYRVEPLAEERADQEYVIRIDCFTLIPDSANLVMTHITPVDFWEEEAPKGDILRDGLVIPEALSDHAKLSATTHHRRWIMIDKLWVETAA